jgi:hypothetical protein
MATIFDADTLICTMLLARPGKVARHKLAYAVYRYSIVKTGIPDFTAFCAALPLGPCFIELLEHPERRGDPNAFSPEAVDRFRAVLDKLGAMSGKALAARSHRNYYEWRTMREGMRNNQVKLNGKCQEIPVSLIRRLPEIQRHGGTVGLPTLAE